MSFLSPSAKVTISSDPFNYMVVEDVFEAAVASSLACLFKELIVEAKGIGKVGEVGELIYDALNFTPRLEHVRTTPISLFVSAEMREFISSAFSIRLDENVMIGMHRHNPPSRAGWAHTDFAVVSFPDIAANVAGSRVFVDGCNCNYADDSRERQPQSLKTARQSTQPFLETGSTMRTNYPTLLPSTREFIPVISKWPDLLNASSRH